MLALDKAFYELLESDEGKIGKFTKETVEKLNTVYNAENIAISLSEIRVWSGWDKIDMKE